MTTSASGQRYGHSYRVRLGTAQINKRPDLQIKKHSGCYRRTDSRESLELIFVPDLDLVFNVMVDARRVKLKRAQMLILELAIQRFQIRLLEFLPLPEQILERLGCNLGRLHLGHRGSFVGLLYLVFHSRHLRTHCSEVGRSCGTPAASSTTTAARTLRAGDRVEFALAGILGWR